MNNRIAKFIIFLFCLTPLIWFYNKPNFLINGVDTNFPLDPAVWLLRRFFVWNAVQNAGSDFSSSTAGIFFHLIQYIPYQIGLSLQGVEIFSFVFWFSAIVIGSWTLAKLWFPKQITVQLLFCCLYAFNIYLFNSWENVKVANLSLAASLPFALALLWSHFRYGIAQPKLLLGFSLISVLVAGAGINPAYFSVFLLILVVYCLSELIISPSRKHILLVVKTFLILLVVSVLINAYWIIPTTNFIFKNIAQNQSIGSIGFNNWVDSLSTNTNIINVWRMMGAWDWYTFDYESGLPLYIPYALNYFTKIPFIMFSFLLPTLALASFLVYEKKSKILYLTFGLMMVLGIVLGTGTNQPTGMFYRWLGEHLPFFSLFRSPWYIFTLLLVIGLNGLVCLFFKNLLESSRINFPRKNLIINLLVAVLVIGNLVYSYPLVTGKIFRPQSTEGFYIKFPDYVFQSQKWLSTQKDQRIIGYPDDEIEKFNWEYRGVESILGLLNDNEVINKSLNSIQSPSAALINQFYIYLKKEQIDLAKSMADKLGAEVLFYKRDQSSLSPELASAIISLPKTTFGLWDFYQLSEDRTPNKITISDKLFTIQNPQRTADILALIDKDGVVINQQDVILPEILNGSKSGELVTTENSHQKQYKKYLDKPDFTNKLGQTDLSMLDFSFTVSTSGKYQPILEKYRLEDFGIDYSKGLELIVDNIKYNLNITKMTDSLIYFNNIDLQSGEHLATLPIKLTNNIYGGDMGKGFSFKLDRNGVFNLETEGDNNYLSIVNRDIKDAGASFTVPNLDPFGIYMVQMRYKQIYGNYAQIVVTQTNGKIVFKSEAQAFPNYPEWNYVSFFTQPVLVKKSNLELKLIAPVTKDPLGTKVLYDDLRFYKIFTNQLFFIRSDQSVELSSGNVEYQKVSPVEYRGKVTNTQGKHILAMKEQYSPDWVLTDPGNSRHFTAQSCCNAWLVENAPAEYEFVIYYWPQKIFQLGAAVAILTFLAILGYFGYSLVKRKQ